MFKRLSIYYKIYKSKKIIIYIDIRKEDIPKKFEIRNYKSIIYMKIGNAKEICIKFPLKLDKDLARISAMFLDGSLDKNLRHFSFSQKKDLSKTKEFQDIIKDKFGITPHLKIDKNGVGLVMLGSRTLSHFLHSCIDINKCDENTKIPNWIYKSSKENI